MFTLVLIESIIILNLKILNFTAISHNDITKNMINKNCIMLRIFTQMIMITHLWRIENRTTPCKFHSRKVSGLKFIFRSQWYILRKIKFNKFSCLHILISETTLQLSTYVLSSDNFATILLTGWLWSVFLYILYVFLLFRYNSLSPFYTGNTCIFLFFHLLKMSSEWFVWS